MTLPQMHPGGHGRAVQRWAIPVKGITDTVSVGGNTNTAVTVALPAPPAPPNQFSGGIQPTGYSPTVANTGTNLLFDAFWSYTAAPTGGRLQIATSDGVVFDQFVGGAGNTEGQFHFDPPLDAPANSAMTATLAAAGNVTGSLVLRAAVQL